MPFIFLDEKDWIPCQGPSLQNQNRRARDPAQESNQVKETAIIMRSDVVKKLYSRLIGLVSHPFKDGLCTFEIRGFLGAIPPYFFSTKTCDERKKKSGSEFHTSFQRAA